jgi:thiol-disulfide isomerase/thioredoxin
MTTRRNLLLAGLAALLPQPLLAQSCSAAPEIAGTGPWFNGPPLSLAGLRGKVVLVEFWTFGCYNCRNVEPYVKDWHQRYAGQGLVVVGVHTPEFAHEADPVRVQAYLAENRIRHPVVMDNDYRIWKRWNNRYWPAMYLLNRSGELCYRHFGEGRYRETEVRIRQLLAEKGA